MRIYGYRCALMHYVLLVLSNASVLLYVLSRTRPSVLCKDVFFFLSFLSIFLSFNVSLWMEKPTDSSPPALIAIVTLTRGSSTAEDGHDDAIVIVMCENVCARLSFLLRTILCPWLSAVLCPLRFKLLRKDFCSSFRRQARLLQTQLAHLHIVFPCQHKERGNRGISQDREQESAKQRNSREWAKLTNQAKLQGFAS